MAGGDKKLQPIIIKRVKKGGHGGHHGGAWKIAYADFVTAMMAFFLLMWLLGSTTKGDLQGIADHFNTPLKVALSGGSGSGDSSSIVKGGGTDLTRTYGNTPRGDIEERHRKVNLQALRAEMNKVEAERMRAVKQKVEQVVLANPRLAEYRSQIKVDITADGLRIQILDDQGRPMFDSGGAHVKDYMRDILRDIGKVLNEVDARISLSGHTDATQYSGGERGYSNWELSADRANASRRELVAGGMDDRKVARIVGLASSVPYDEKDPAAAINRRISIVVLNRVAEERVLKGTELEAHDGSDVSRAVQTGKGALAPAGGPDAGGSESAAASGPASAAPRSIGKRSAE